ncbi:MAG: VanZ family protein [Chloroflexi bacterium]|nr:VanZ family protein [Chloroflexota bacterium]
MFSVSYGIFDELHQIWIPARAFQLLDLGFDILKILIGLSLFTLYKSRV